MSEAKNRTGGSSPARSLSTDSDYRTPISFYVMMGGILVGLLLALAGLFII